MIAPGVQALARAIAAAVADLPSGLPALRVLSDTDDIAAAKMASLLAAAGLLDDALAAAQAAYSRFGDPSFPGRGRRASDGPRSGRGSVGSRQ